MIISLIFRLSAVLKGFSELKRFSEFIRLGFHGKNSVEDLRYPPAVQDPMGFSDI